ncbi:MAG: hypothetical protein ABI782_13100 [Anaerolineaceae bacterium]
MTDEQKTTELAPENPAERAEVPAEPEATEVTALRAELSARELRERAALDQFRTALLATEPEMDPGLVTGDSFETIHASFGAARASLARVREALRQEAAAQVPLGAPGRMSQRHRTALEKIRDGLSSP